MCRRVDRAQEVSLECGAGVVEGRGGCGEGASWKAWEACERDGGWPLHIPTTTKSTPRHGGGAWGAQSRDAIGTQGGACWLSVPRGAADGVRATGRCRYPHPVHRSAMMTGACNSCPAGCSSLAGALLMACRVRIVTGRNLLAASTLQQVLAMIPVIVRLNPQ